jgi:hypothetical protein
MRKKLIKTTRLGLLVGFALFFSGTMAQNLRINPQIPDIQIGNSLENSPTKHTSTPSEGQSPFDAVKGKREDKSKRDAFSKHYINEDGSFTALIGAGPIHYQKNGQFLDIDHTITSNFDPNFPYSNTTNLFESYFGSTSHKGVKNKTSDGEILEFLNTKMYWEVNGQMVNVQHSANKPVRIDGDKAYYDNLYGAISAEFISQTGKRKLNYIIPNQNALGNIPSNAEFLVFSEDVVLPFGWTASKTDLGVIIKDQLGKEIYLYDNPVSTDVLQDELNAQDNTIFEILQLGNTLTIKTKVKTPWLLNNERVYPVKVDPTVNVYPNNTTRWTRSVYSNGTEVTSGTLYFGLQSNMWLTAHARFNTSSIADGSIINSAIGYINITAGTGTSPASRQWQFANSANPVTTSGSALYNSANLGYSTIVTVTGTGWRNSTLYNPQGNQYIENQLSNQAINLSIYPTGTFSNNTYMTVANHTVSNRPYLIINYHHALIVTNAYTDASLEDGRHGFDTNTSVTITSGTRPGYVCVGWTGTGSVPATGNENSVTIIMTENSSINWMWELEPGNPSNVLFYNYGGDEQLTFNNSKIESITPTFRLSHLTDPASEYQIEINSNSNFSGGISWVETFSGNFPLATETNFTFSNGFTPNNETTYYVRARVKGIANNWSNWTTETYSFTYQSPKEIPDWFQTTQAQFLTDGIEGLVANSSGDVLPILMGNVIVNGSFEPNLNGWTISKPSWFTVASEAYGNTDGTRALNIYNSNPGSTGNFSGDTAGVHQTINMNGVTTLSIDLGYESTTGSNLNTFLEVWISDTNQTSLRTGTKVFYWKPTANVTTGNPFSINLSSYGFTGNKLVKLVTYYEGATDYVERYYYFDNLRTTSIPQGTITSTPIHLASVQEAIGYAGVRWNQTLGTGDFKLTVQGSSDGNNFSNISGFTDLSLSGDGEKFVDLSTMTIPPPHIRLVGNLNGENVVLHDWAVEFLKNVDECPNSTIWNGTSWSNGIPNDATTKIIFDGNYTSDASNTISGELIGCSLEVISGNVTISPEHNVSIENEIKVASTASFTLENNANLVQIAENAENEGIITVKKISTPMIRQDATGWSSPVAGQNVRNFSTGTLKKRYYIYNGYGIPGTSGSNFKAIFEYDPLYPMPSSIPSEWPGTKLANNQFFDETAYTFQKGWGYSIRVPNNWPSSVAQSFPATFVGEPHNGNVTVPAYGKYTMAGNPYPSAIDADEFLTINEDVSTLHFWTHHFPVGHNNYNYNYVTYTLLGGAGQYPEDAGPEPNGRISVGQAFILEHATIVLEESNTSWPVHFDNSMRTTSSALFYKNNPDIEKHRFWLNLLDENEERTAQILVGYMTGATEGLDHQIDGKRMGSSPLYSLIAGEKLTVQGRPLPFSQEDIVPIGFNSSTKSKYSIQIDDLDGLFAEGEVYIYIKDNLLGIKHNLSESKYEFESEAGEFLDRFEIIYLTEEILENEEMEINSITIYQTSQNIVIQSKTDKIISVELWDLSGKQLHHKSSLFTQKYEMNRTQYGTQILLVKVRTQSGEIFSKKIINQ